MSGQQLDLLAYAAEQQAASVGEHMYGLAGLCACSIHQLYATTGPLAAAERAGLIHRFSMTRTQHVAHLAVIEAAS